jgi:SLT domain-containing protein
MATQAMIAQTEKKKEEYSKQEEDARVNAEKLAKTQEDAANAATSAWGKFFQWLNDMWNDFWNWAGEQFTPSMGNMTVPGFANGVNNFKGGFAMVGEMGPELVYLPTGSNVYSNSETKSMLSNSATNNINVVVNMGNNTNAQQVGKEIANQVALRLARQGLN